MRWVLLLFFLFQSAFAMAQRDSSNVLSAEQAKRVVFQIVRYSGLSPDFVVQENEDVTTAIAFIRNNQRYIEYNPNTMASVNNTADTDWAAMSILAHEIAHHLLGHTLDPSSLGPGDELACDKYSGFILARMGATEDEAIAAINALGSEQPRSTHPPKSARVQAILQGYTEAQLLDSDHYETVQDLYQYLYRIEFDGDRNHYYVNELNEVVWIDEYAKPIVFGNLANSETKNYQYKFEYDNLVFLVDRKGKIWSMTRYGVFREVGELIDL